MKSFSSLLLETKPRENEIKKHENKMIEKNEKIATSNWRIGFIVGATIGALVTVGGSGLYWNNWSRLQDNNLEKAKMEYVNNDSLPDLKFPNGDIYLQTNEGKFVSYESVMQEKKAKLDSIYQMKQDFLKKVFENKLEKEVLGK